MKKKFPFRTRSKLIDIVANNTQKRRLNKLLNKSSNDG